MDRNTDIPLTDFDFKVIINCMTYNQSQYILDTLNGFAIQNTTFPYNCVVVDDASQDGAQDVIRSFINKECDKDSIIIAENALYQFLYAKHKFNNNCFFSCYFLKINLYKDQETKDSLLKEWRRHSTFEAMCEGDDYWIDSKKLQKQVDFLESHPDYSMCFTNSITKSHEKESVANKYIWDTYNTRQMILHNSLGAKKRGDNIVPAGHTSTILFKIPSDSLPRWTRQCFIGDEPLFISLSTYGKAKFINECTSVYRKGVGVSSMNFSYESDWNNRIKMYRTINKGLHFRYNYTIRSIIAHYYFKLSKIALSTGEYLQLLKNICLAAANNPFILLFRWLY